MQHRGMNVGDVMRVFDRMETKFVRAAMHRAALDATASQPNGKSVRMVVAACEDLVGIANLDARRASELGTKHNDRIIPHAATFQIL